MAGPFSSSGFPTRTRAVMLDESNGSAAGVHTATIRVPAGILLDVQLIPVAQWNAGTSATGKVGDTDDDGYWTGINLKTLDVGKVLSVAGGVAGEAGVGVYIDGSAHAFLAGYSAVARTIKAIVTCVGTVGTLGRTLLVVTSSPQGTTESTFVAS